MAMVRILMSLATIAILFGSTMAANHTVGAPKGRWDESTDLTTWAASETFLVGDSLIFVYTPNHDVLEVRKADYDSCQTTNAISTNGGGMTIISLSSTGKRYFICGTGGHCASGMKLEVNTLATAPVVPPPVSPPVKSPVSAPSPKIAPKISPVSAPSPKNAPKSSPVSAPSPKSLALTPKNAPKSSPVSAPSPKSLALTPKNAPKSSPAASSPETPSLPPSSTDFVPTSSPSSSPSVPSSADKISVIASSTVGFGLVTMMLFFM